MKNNKTNKKDKTTAFRWEAYQPYSLSRILDWREIQTPAKAEIETKVKTKASDKQEGGTHYKDMAIQPVVFSMKNKLNTCQANVVKYICRYKDKNGKEDLLKAKHYIDLLIEMEYSEGNNEQD